MKPLLDQAFWSDPDVEAQKPGVKLAAIWLITNSRTSLLGICGASPQRFEFETGLPAKALKAAVEALPRSFVSFGDVVFVRNYIRHQFGTGDKLTKNNFFVALKSLFSSVKDRALADCILEEYPEFDQALSVIHKDARDHTVAAGLRSQIFERDEFTCLFTGVRLEASELEADHVVPRSKGGKTVPENLVAVSKKMNTLKNNKDLADFCAEQNFDFIRITETIQARASKPLSGLSKPKYRIGGEREERKGSPEGKPESREAAHEYGKEIGMPSADVDAWFDHFESNGWKVSGKAAMKDWRAALRNGNRRRGEFPTAPPTNQMFLSR